MYVVDAVVGAVEFTVNAKRAKVPNSVTVTLPGVWW